VGKIRSSFSLVTYYIGVTMPVHLEVETYSSTLTTKDLAGFIKSQVRERKTKSNNVNEIYTNMDNKFIKLPKILR